MLLADKLPPQSVDTTAPDETTTVPGTTDPITPDTTTPPTDDTTAPDGDITTPSDSTTPTVPDDTTSLDTTPDTYPDDNDQNTIILTRDPGDTDQAPSFTSDTNLLDIIIISIDNRPLTKDEYSISSDSKHITLHPSSPLTPGEHTLTIYTETAHGEVTFTIAGSEVSRRAFPFWILWVIPHVLADIAGLICIAIVIAKRKDEDEQEQATDETDTDSDNDILND
jgi:hypothetical protein